MVLKLLKTLALLLGVMVFGRLIMGPPKPKGLVVMTDIRASELRTAAFEVSALTKFTVDATGSAEDQLGVRGLAANAWILDAEARAVVWDMQEAPMVAGKGTIRHVEGDTIVLLPGFYEVYFATYGQKFGNFNRVLSQDRKAWKFVLRTEEKGAAARRLDHTPVESVNPSTVWEATRLERAVHREYFFEVALPTTVAVRATGQVSQDPLAEVKDGSRIENAISGERVWSLTVQNSEPAGGSQFNRTFSGEVALRPGVYRAVAETDRSHGFGHWRANPPYDPASWGVEITAADPNAVHPFDPWSSREPVVSFMRVGNNEQLHERFGVKERVSVFVYGVGELVRDHPYDFAQLVRELPDRQEFVWKMSRSNSKHAGGASKNRFEAAFIVLEPGNYTLEYETDDSHAWDSWNADRPEHSERWGVSMFPVAQELRPGTIVRLDGP